MFEDAVRLYDLALSHDKAMKLLNQLLSRHLSEPTIPGSTKDRIKTLALEIAHRLVPCSHMKNDCQLYFNMKNSKLLLTLSTV